MNSVLKKRHLLIAILMMIVFACFPMQSYAKQVTIRFFSKNGTEYKNYKKKVKAKKKILLPDVPEFTYVCYGWSTKPNGGGKKYASWTKQGFKKNTKLYAMVWRENTIKSHDQKKIFSAAKYMHNTMVKMNKKTYGLWEYRNNNVAGSFKKALKTGRYWTDCSRGAVWLARQAGLSFDKDYICININGTKSVKQMLYNGELKCGDRIDYYDFNHTNTYLGQNLWFDTGRAYCKSSNVGAPFLSWIGGTKTWNRRIARIYRLKDAL